MNRIKLLAVSTAALVAVTTVTMTAGQTATASETAPPEGTGTTTAGPTTVGTMTTGRQSIDWGRCRDGFLRSAGARCGFVSVPLDYDDPTGRRTRIPVSRISHTAARPQGVMLVNPGGPGASGLSAAYLGRLMPRRVGAMYDWIGFGPRGVKPSRPSMSCRWSFRAPNVPYVPANAGQVQAWLRISRLTARGCARNGVLLRNMRTADHARDMDEIRKALGVEQVSFYGYSYGSYLGQVYASLFPSRVRRMVLDSNVDPTTTWYEYSDDAILAFERSYEVFFRWIARHQGTYRLGRNGSTVKKTYLSQRRLLRTRPAARGFGPNEWDNAFSEVGYNQQSWPPVARAFAAWVNDRNIRPLVRVLRELPDFTQNEAAAFLATACTDSPWPGPGQLVRDARRLHKVAPVNAWPLTWGTAPCTYWPVPGGPLVEVGNGVRMLLVGQTLDAATPFHDSFAVRRVFPESRLVAIRGGTTHASSPELSGPCANARIFAYLTRGALPPRDAGAGPDVVCSAPPQPRPGGRVQDPALARLLTPLHFSTPRMSYGGDRR